MRLRQLQRRPGQHLEDAQGSSEAAGSIRTRRFNTVEIVVAEKIGKETATDVRNIYKYDAAYRLTQEAEESLRQLREKVAPGGK